jgi:hypothetical protein
MDGSAAKLGFGCRVRETAAKTLGAETELVAVSRTVMYLVCQAEVVTSEVPVWPLISSQSLGISVVDAATAASQANQR